GHPIAGRSERLRFRMRAAAGLRPALSGDLAILNDQAADIGIGGGEAAAALTQRDRFLHPSLVGQNPYRLRALSACWKSCRLAASRRAFSAAARSILARVSASVRLAGQLSMKVMVAPGAILVLPSSQKATPSEIGINTASEPASHWTLVRVDQNSFK